MLEVNIESAANKHLKNEGWLCLKVKFYEAGWPDRLYIHLSGLHVWIEYKRNETQTKPYPRQEARLRELAARGVWATWTDNPNDAIWYCRTALVAKGVPSGRYQNAIGTRSSSFVPGPWPWVVNDKLL
jgi:hypothetical protein